MACRGLHHALSLEESDEMAEALGRFGEVAGTVSREPGDIALYDGVIHLAEGIALPVQPSSKLLTGAQKALDTDLGHTLVVEGGREVIQVWPQGTTAQPGNHDVPDKDVFEHGLLLFLKVDWKRRRIARLDHAE